MKLPAQISTFFNALLYGSEEEQRTLNETEYKKNEPINVPAHIYNKAKGSILDRRRDQNAFAAQDALEAIRRAAESKPAQRRSLFVGQMIEIAEKHGYRWKSRV